MSPDEDPRAEMLRLAEELGIDNPSKARRFGYLGALLNQVREMHEDLGLTLGDPRVERLASLNETEIEVRKLRRELDEGDLGTD
jgi:hypothetical protein